jgi:hypothetical protein
MLNCKTYFVAAAGCLFAFAGCLESRYSLEVNSTLDNNAGFFLAQLPGIKNTPYGGQKIIDNAKKLFVYKASFAETSIEKDNLVEFTGQNRKSKLPRAAYRDVDGFVQDLYLLHYGFTYDAEGEASTAAAVVFLSLRYRPMRDAAEPVCTGPGPLYWGVVEEDEGFISFDSVLTIKKSGTSHYLHAVKPGKKNAFNLLFMPAAFTANGAQPASSFNIAKIVRMENNRIGGTKPLVFDIPAIFSDSNALHFDHVKTITLKH